MTFNFTVDLKPSTEDLVREYCGFVHNRIAYLVLIGMLFWLLEPLYKKAILKWCESKFRENDALYFSVRDYAFMLYKWIGLGILIMSAGVIWFL